MLIWMVIHLLIISCCFACGCVGAPAYMIGLRQGKNDQKIEDLERHVQIL